MTRSKEFCSALCDPVINLCNTGKESPLDF